MSRPSFSRRSHSHGIFNRVNGRIRAREVRVIGENNQQIGVLPLGEAITLARSRGQDLVEVVPTATPPVCRVIDYGKFRYTQTKKEKESRKHQHANRVKEIQLRPAIDPHDFTVKLNHAVDFLCDDMKVKVSLRFRGREMAHKEFGYQVINKFLDEVAPYGHPDSAPRLGGRMLVVMVSPLPRNKRAPNPRQQEAPSPASEEQPAVHEPEPSAPKKNVAQEKPAQGSSKGFVNNPFAKIDSPSRQTG